MARRAVVDVQIDVVSVKSLLRRLSIDGLVNMTRSWARVLRQDRRWKPPRSTDLDDVLRVRVMKPPRLGQHRDAAGRPIVHDRNRRTTLINTKLAPLLWRDDAVHVDHLISGLRSVCR
jgi:hypothetical protein